MNLIQALAIVGTSSIHYTDAERLREAEAIIDASNRRFRDLNRKEALAGFITVEDTPSKEERIVAKKIRARTIKEAGAILDARMVSGHYRASWGDFYDVIIPAYEKAKASICAEAKP